MEKKIFNLLILDESGSMQSIAKETISGYNEIIQTIKKTEEKFPQQKQHITLVTFNSNGIKTVFDKAPINLVKAFEAKDYNPDAMTPLWDAVGHSVNKLLGQLKNENDFAVLVSILTDGYENDSREFNAAQIKQLIESLPKETWTFSYFGANQDVYKVAQDLTIPKGNVSSFIATDPTFTAKMSRSVMRHSSMKFEKFHDAIIDIFKEEDATDNESN